MANIRIIPCLDIKGPNLVNGVRLDRLRTLVLDVEKGVSRKLFEFTPTPQFTGLLPFFDQHQRTLTLWSPDNRYLVMPVQTQSGPRIAVAQADGDFAPRLLEAGTLAVWSWR